METRWGMVGRLKDCIAVTTWAVKSRLVLLGLQAVLHTLIPDHIPSMEDVFMKVHRSPPHMLLVEHTLGGLDNWDAEYFIFNAHSGYGKYEQTMAFFPFFPLVMRVVASTFLLPLSWVVSQRTIMLISGVLINFLVFPLAACSLFLLTVTLTRDRKLSILAASLFCFNPASIFMLAVYSETLFSFFTFLALLALVWGYRWTSAVLISLATATRSNGVVLCGFLGYHCLKDIWDTLSSLRYKMWQRKLSQIVIRLVLTTLQCILAIGPFIGFQCYGYFLYCTGATATSLPHPEWCGWTIPVPYSFIQEHYWNVGFLRYFELKQLPNFLLASPMLCLVIYSVFLYSSNENKSSNGLKGKESTIGSVTSFFRSADMRPYIFHLVFLSVFGFFNMHVQVLTRFLASSSPVIYWASAVCLLRSLTSLKAENIIQPNVFSLSEMIVRIVRTLYSAGEKGECVLISKAILLYFLAYILLGCALHCNFYPWT